LERSLAHQRLGHGLLFVSDDSRVADEAAIAVASALLMAVTHNGMGGPNGGYGGEAPNNNPRPEGGGRGWESVGAAVKSHADYMRVDPMNKQRQIGVEPMRGLREFLQKSSLTGVKVAHISQAERLQSSAANLFLKILEEPPENSYIIMTTSAPQAVLPTLVSRSMRFRFSQKPTAKDAALEEWKKMFVEALLRGEGDDLLKVYALIGGAHALLSAKEDDAESLPKLENIEPEVEEALIASRAKMAQKNLFACLEEAALEAFKRRPCHGYRLKEALEAVERVYRMLEFNLNAPAAMESAISGVAKALR